MQRHVDMEALILYSEEKHDNRSADRTHHRVVEELHREAPFHSFNLLCYRLFGQIICMIASVAQKHD